MRCLGVLLLAAGCTPSVFFCTQSSECGNAASGGVCEAVGVCSFADATCESGRRYQGHAGALSNKCIDIVDMAASCGGLHATNCGGACTSLQSDTQNCGACGRVCATDQYCLAGNCTSTCPLTVCNGTCVDTQTDAANCGACGITCDVAGGEACSGGRCGCGALTDCGGVCVDVSASLQNCGGCGNACAIGQFCDQGVCECPTATPNACSAGVSARFFYPSGLRVSANDLYLADSGNQTIRRIDLTTDLVTTLAGVAENRSGLDGTGTSASFHTPTDVCLDAMPIT